MLVRQAFRYELTPTPVQRVALSNHAGAARWAWNWGLSVRRKAFARRRQTLTAMDLHRLLNRLKRTQRYGWLYEVSKCAPAGGPARSRPRLRQFLAWPQGGPAGRVPEVQETGALPGAVSADRRDPRRARRGGSAPHRSGRY